VGGFGLLNKDYQEQAKRGSQKPALDLLPKNFRRFSWLSICIV
jgi:hypothetical protein|tara:strand:+ start:376 stop:504 length:129 start_codon:yes stop_codon:yes gene_type:complete